eukprot:jgi/Orpsp1_1/1180985/evm.model.c7180000075366.1
MLLTSSVFANDCDEINKYVKNHSKTLKTEISCKVNDNGKVTELALRNQDLSDEDVNNIFSYDTITKASYTILIEDVAIVDMYYPEILKDNFTDVFSKLPNLEELYLDYECYEEHHYYSTYPTKDIEKGILKLSKNLKKLTLEQIKLTTDDIKDIANLTNLEELELVQCSFENAKFDSFKSLTNLKSVKLSEMCSRPEHYCAAIPKNLLTSLKSEHLSD